MGKQVGKAGGAGHGHQHGHGHEHRHDHGHEHGRRRPGGLARLVRLAMFAVAVAAVTKELQKDPADRTWHGTVGFVPYEFRMPTLERAKERLWNPDSEQIVGPHVFGVGWSVNVGRVVELVRRGLADSSTT